MLHFYRLTRYKEENIYAKEIDTERIALRITIVAPSILFD